MSSSAFLKSDSAPAASPAKNLATPRSEYSAASQAEAERAGQSETLFKAVQRLHTRSARRAKSGDPINALLIKTLLEEFEDAGVSLPPSQRRRAKEINDRITALGQAFDKNIRDANVLLAFATDELRGVPEAQRPARAGLAANER